MQLALKYHFSEFFRKLSVKLMRNPLIYEVGNILFKLTL